jgi:hypothetical protein
VTLPAWWHAALTTPEGLTALGAIAELGGEWVALTATGYQNDPLSVEIAADVEKTATIESLATAIDTAHQLGLKVLLKPHLNLLVEDKDDHMWRGMIKPRTPAEVQAWFASYQAFLMPFVDLAIRRRVEMMTVGVELRNLVGHADHWRALIKAVRERGYRGRLTYAALHESYGKVKFWDALDYVGIDAYFPIARRMNANLKQTLAGCARLAQKLGKYSAKVGKPIVFTEVGYNNLSGCSTRPWYWSGNRAEVNNVEQAACYHAILEVFPRQEWFAGMFWWSWSPSRPTPSKPDYSPQSKLAELILRSYYQQPTPQ